jgi:hypothetical protein
MSKSDNYFKLRQTWKQKGYEYKNDTGVSCNTLSEHRNLNEVDENVGREKF